MVNVERRRLLLTGGAMLAAGSLRAPALAQTYPSRPVTLVVPFPPGGTSDTMARLVAQELARALGQPVVVDNRAGANGNIGSASVARAAPDGHTLLLSGIGSHAINAGLYRAMPYDPVRDFSHITLIASGPNAIAVNPAFPARTLAEFVALLRREPDRHNYASSGIGSSGNMAMELFKQKAGLSIVHVPYRGGAPATTDVLAGQVPILITNADAVLTHAREGKLRILAVTSERRAPLYPDTPTIAEAGFPEVVAVSWTGISGPPGLPPAIVHRLQAEVTKAVRGPLQERLAGLGLVPGGVSSEEFAGFVAAEMARWKAVAAAANLTVE